jgi:hypothetical protein
MPFASLETTTVAFGTTASELSRTTPEIAANPAADCAGADMDASRNKPTAIHALFPLMRLSISCEGFSESFREFNRMIVLLLIVGCVIRLSV